MVTCKHCSTPNSLDSTFCKRCGTALPEDDVTVAQEKLAALIAEGNTAFNEGRTDEAMAIAESACMSNPSSTAALSLKALCHERRGELAEALECADTIVDLNPDSELDKIKRNQLRTKLSVSVQLATQPPDRKTALIGAVAAVVLMVCLGIGAAKYVNRPQASSPSGFVAKNDTPPTNSTQQNPLNGGANQQAVPPTQPAVQPRVDVPQYTGPTGPNPGRNQQPLLDSGSVLPQPGRDDGTEIQLKGDIPVNPPVPNPEKSGSNTGVVKSPSNPTTSDRPTTSDDPNPKPDEAKGAQQEQGPGQIDIKISNGSKRAFGGSSESVGSGGATALDKIGIQRYQLGNYPSAAASFEQAIRSGGDQVTLNQWLARCYDKIGKKTEEVEAYKKCVTACQSALNSGTGNKDRLHAILETCQQELKVLQGN